MDKFLNSEYSRRKFLKLAGMGIAGMAVAAGAASLPGGALLRTAMAADGTGKKSLIVFFSRADENYGIGYIEKGNTQKVAEQIAALNGGDLFHVETVSAYPTKYDDCTVTARQEQGSNARPALKATLSSLDGYDTVYLGYPIWWGDLPMAMYTFLESFDWSGKTILPFCTHEGSGLSGTVQKIASVCKGAAVLDGLAIRGRTAQQDEAAVRSALNGWMK